MFTISYQGIHANLEKNQAPVDMESHRQLKV